MTHQTFYLILILWCAFAAISFVILLFKPAPYGRHSQKDTKLLMNGTLGWMVMEVPSVIVFAWVYLMSHCLKDYYSIIFLILWEVHYIHRTFIFAWRRRHTAEPMPVLIVILGALFNAVNAFLNSYWINTLSPKCPEKWVFEPIFIFGITLFILGFIINFTADEKLLKLRRTGGPRYKIPRGGLYEYISCPNYFGEIVEWLGFALASLSPAAFAFVLWTSANLVPRALSHHAWYLKQFDDYPKNRKAIFPFML